MNYKRLIIVLVGNCKLKLVIMYMGVFKEASTKFDVCNSYCRCVFIDLTKHSSLTNTSNMWPVFSL